MQNKSLHKGSKVSRIDIICGFNKILFPQKVPLLVMTKVMVADFFLIDRAGPPFQLPTELMFVYVHTLLYFLILTARWGLKFIYKIYIRYFLKIYLDNRESLDILVVSSETLKILALYFNPSFARY